jgi:FkbM family methyltransferase
MFRARAAVETAVHRLWKVYAAGLFFAWRRLGLRTRYLSSKGQDRWIIEEIFPRMRDGFFVELGAGDGFTGSDTFVLEREYGWKGLCIEPNPILFRKLTRNVRRACTCVRACVDASTGPVDFAIDGDRSGIVASDTDNSPAIRSTRLQELYAARRVRVLKTCSLAEILAKHGAPKVINYLSLDVEGAEERILSSFPFNRFDVLALTVERPTKRIHQILTSAGFVLARYHWYDGFYTRSHLVTRPAIPAVVTFRRKEF